MDPAARATQRALLQRTPGLRAWRRRPWVWFGVALLLLGLFDWGLASGNADDLAAYRRGEVISATVLPSWDGDVAVPVRYRNPSTGRLLDIVVPEDIAAVHRVGPVRLHIAPGHPDEGRVVGSRQSAHVVTDQSILIADSIDATSSSWPALMILTVIVLAGLALWAWRRKSRVRAAVELLSVPVAIATLLAMPRRGWPFARHWRLDLFPVGAGPGDRSVGRVRVAPGAGGTEPRAVEVYGDGDRWRGQVFQEVGEPVTWVPLGRPLRRHVVFAARRPRGLDVWLPIGLLPIAFGIALMVVGASHERDLIPELNRRSQPVVVTIQRAVPVGGDLVPITYRFDGRTRTSTSTFGGPLARGDRVLRRIDPVRPTVLWQDGANSPPTDGTNLRSDLTQVAGGFVVFVGLFFLRRPRNAKEAGRAVVAAATWAQPASPPAWSWNDQVPPRSPEWAVPGTAQLSVSDPPPRGSSPPPLPPTPEAEPRSTAPPALPPPPGWSSPRPPALPSPAPGPHPPARPKDTPPGRGEPDPKEDERPPPPSPTGPPAIRLPGTLSLPDRSPGPSRHRPAPDGPGATP